MNNLQLALVDNFKETDKVRGFFGMTLSTIVSYYEQTGIPLSRAEIKESIDEACKQLRSEATMH